MLVQHNTITLRQEILNEVVTGKNVPHVVVQTG